jgi:hypothetical protein
MMHVAGIMCVVAGDWKVFGDCRPGHCCAYYSALSGCSGAALGWCSTRRHLRLHESNQWGLRSMQQPSLCMLQPVW